MKVSKKVAELFEGVDPYENIPIYKNGKQIGHLVNPFCPLLQPLFTEDKTYSIKDLYAPIDDILQPIRKSFILSKDWIE